MFVPLKDDTPHQVIRFQFVTAVLVAFNVAIFLVTGPLFGTEAAFGIAEGYGVVPVELLSVTGRGSHSVVAEPVTLITYQFLHGGWLLLSPTCITDDSAVCCAQRMKVSLDGGEWR